MTEVRSPLSPESVARYDAWYDTPWGAYADARERARFSELARPRSGERALDLGCGTGRYLAWLLSMGLDAFGVEPSHDMLEVAAARLGGEGVRGNRLIAADGRALPFRGSVFDLVTAITVLEFVADEDAVLREMARVCRGRLFLGVLNSASKYGRQIEEGEMGQTLSRAHLRTVEEWVELVSDAISPARLTWRTCLLGPKVESAAELEPQRRLDSLPGSARLPWGAFVGILAEFRS